MSGRRPGPIATTVLVVVLALGATELGLPLALVGELTLTLAAAVVLVRLADRLAVPRATRRPRRVGVADGDRVAAVRAQLVAAQGSRSGAYTWLGPTLRPLVAHRSARHGLRPDDVQAARGLLGDELALLAGPGARRPTDRDAPGLDAARLAALVTRLEQL